MICRYCHKEAPEAPFCCWCGKKQEVQRNTHKRGNGQGSAFKRGKTWTGVRTGYQYTDEDGNHRKRPTKGGFATKKEALEWASATTVSEEYLPKLIDLWELYKANDLPKLSKNKQTAYKIARNKLEPLMATQIHLLTLEAIQAAINAKCPTYYPAHDCKTVLSQLYKKAMANNNCPVSKNLAAFIVLPEFEEKEAEPFTADEVKAFWTLYDKGDYFAGYILLLCYTGMMPAELMACTKDMVDLDKLEIFGCGAKTKSRRKSAIVFPEILRPVVETLLSYKTKNNKLLTAGREAFYVEYYECLERAGVRKLPPYSCRHTFGTEAVKLGAHPAVIKKLLRHSNQRTQERYTHMSADDAHEALKNVSRG